MLIDLRDPDPTPREEREHFVCRYLASHPCIDCGETDILVLEFDHRRDKKKNVTQLMATGPLEDMVLEIQKCEIRCANCHIKRHVTEHHNHYRIEYLKKYTNKNDKPILLRDLIQMEFTNENCNRG